MTKRQFNIALMRELAGYSQQEVADALGIKKARYGDWERETTILNLRDAIRLADLFGCTLDELANHPVPERPTLTSDEREVLDGYRMLDERARRRVRRNVSNEVEDMELDAIEKKKAV